MYVAIVKLQRLELGPVLSNEKTKLVRTKMQLDTDKVTMSHMTDIEDSSCNDNQL
jgi:hypothetical protein